MRRPGQPGRLDVGRVVQDATVSAQPFNAEITVRAYAHGVFPMADDGGQIGWYSPDPRAIIPLEGFHVPRTLRQICRQHRFDVRIDTDFEAVMRACADRDEGTWISDRIVEVYGELHRAGLAHSVESWLDGELVGGLYGVSLGGLFAGESMFSRVANASKVALVHLVERMRKRGCTLLDVQYLTDHLIQFGAVEIPREAYLVRLGAALRLPCRLGE